MRRLITVIVLTVVLLLAAAFSSHPAPARESFYIRRDASNSVICYSTTADFSSVFSCVYVPPDGVQVNLPKPGPATT